MLGVVSRQRRAALRRPGFTSFRLGVADGSTVACETAGGVAYAISIDGGRPIPLGVRISTFSEVDFSPDGSLLAVGAYDPTVTTVSAYAARVDGLDATRLPFGGFSFGRSLVEAGSRSADTTRTPATPLSQSRARTGSI